MMDTQKLLDRLPPRMKQVCNSIVAGAVIGGATGGLAEMARGFTSPHELPTPPSPGHFTKSIHKQRQHPSYRNHHRY